MNRTRTNRGTIAKALGAVGIVLAMLLGWGTFATQSASAVAPLAVNQCNSVFNGGGRGMDCTVTVTNYYNLDTGFQSSTTTTVACDGAANTVPLPHCVTTIIPSTLIVTSVTQCDGAANGGGASLICHVHVINQIFTAGAAPLHPSATVNECAGSGIPGTAPTTVCNPTTTVTSADVTQCNGSGNGGTASLIVQCTVDPASESTGVAPVLIDQCNGSSNGGGATVLCGANLEFQLLTLAADVPSSAVASVTDNGVTNFVPPAPVGGGAPSGSGGTPTAGPTLANTGVNVGDTPILALILVLAGFNLVLFARRRGVI
ncbi:MAG: hypothetical protein V4479_16135 [Actinomycetota bacterium]